MRFLADQDVYAATIRLLRDLGHDVITASDLAMSRAADAQLLAIAQADDRLFITRDRDFGNLVFVQGQICRSAVSSYDLRDPSGGASRVATYLECLQ